MDQLPSRHHHPTSAAHSGSMDSTNPEDQRDRSHSTHLGDNLPELKRSNLSSSWGTLFGAGISDFETSSETSETPYLENSQPDISDLLQTPPSAPGGGHLFEARHGYQLSYELALDNVLTPIASSQPTSPRVTKSMSHLVHVTQEMITTEQSYVRDLCAIIEGYFVPMEAKIGILPVHLQDLTDLFSNLADIRDFNQSLLQDLQACGHSAKGVGQCFLDKAEGFKIYTQYCTNYPTAVNVLARLSKDLTVSVFLKECQQRLKHMLPLGAYLLKPVQRVLKYSLLLGQLSKHMKTRDPGYATVYKALSKMTEVAEHINAMKKKFDAAVHVQEIQSLIRGWEELDLTKYGELVLEEHFRYYGGRGSGPTFRTRTDRYLFLFQKLFLVTKKEEDGFQYKTHLEMKDLQLTERIEKEPNSFQIRQVSTGRFYTFQARGLEVKEQWVKTVKLLLMESIPHLPDKAKLLILAGFPTDLTEATKKTPVRQRHSSEDMLHSGDKKGRRPAKNEGTKAHGQERSRARGPRKRTSTSPLITVTSPTHSLIKASFTGYVTATISTHRENDVCKLDESEEVLPVTENGHHGTSSHNGYSDAFPVGRHSKGQVTVGTPTNQDAGAVPSLGQSRRSEEDHLHYPRKGPFTRGFLYSSSRSTSGSPEPATFESSRRLSSSLDDIATPLYPSPVVSIDVESDNDETPGHVFEEPSSRTASQLLTNGVASHDSGVAEGESVGSGVSDEGQIPSDSGPERDTSSEARYSTDFSDVSEPPHGQMSLEQVEPTELGPTSWGQEDHVTDAEEQLFNDLMHSTDSASFAANFHDNDVGPPARVLPSSSSYSGDNESLSEDDASNMRSQSATVVALSDHDETPKASPRSIRRWAVQKRPQHPPSSDNLESDDLHTTPKASPVVVPRHYKTPSDVLSPSSSTEDITVVEPSTRYQDERGEPSHPIPSKVPSPKLSSRDLETTTEENLPTHNHEPTVKDNHRVRDLENTGKDKPLAHDLEPTANDGPASHDGEPKVKDKHILKVKSSAIVRRHSYNDQFSKRFRNRTGRRSSGSSPDASPKIKLKDSGNSGSDGPSTPVDAQNKERHHTPVRLRRRSSLGHENDIRSRPISMVGLVSTTRADTSLEDLMSIDAVTKQPSLNGWSPGDQAGASATEQAPDLSRVHPTSERQGSPVPGESDSSPSPSHGRHHNDSSPKSRFRLARYRKHKSPLATTAYSEGAPSDRETSPLSPEIETPVSEDVHPLDPIVDQAEPGEVIPYEGNPEEHITFDEILAGFDSYASATGRTTRSRDKYQKESPEPAQVKRKKRLWRRKTVATVDSDTMKDVRAYMSSEEKEETHRGESKVQALARKYSRMIREHQHNRAMKRYSTVAEGVEEDRESTTEEPPWLKSLKDKNKTRSQNSQEEEVPIAVSLAVSHADRTGILTDSPAERRPVTRTKSFTLPRIQIDEHSEASNVPPPRLRRRSSTASEEGETDLHGRGRFKGWVRSLVERFSSSPKEK